MRTGFILVRGLALRDERFETLAPLAARIHRLRGDRPLHLSRAVLGNSEDGPNGFCVAVRLDDAIGGELVGYVFCPETQAYVWPLDREALSSAMRAQVPEGASDQEAAA